MANEQTSTADDLTAEVAEDTGPERQTYTVVNALYKRGRTWRAGSNIELDEKTAAAFLETGDIKEKK